MGSNNPGNNLIQVLSNVKNEFLELANPLKINSADPRANDLPDVYDTAADMLGSIISCKSGFDPKANTMQMVADFDSFLLAAERGFVQNMEKQMNQISRKIEDMNDEINERVSRFRKSIDELGVYHLQCLRKIDEKHDIALEELQNKLRNQINYEQGVELGLKEQLEQSAKSEIEQYQQQWNQRLKKADLQIESLQKELQHLSNTKFTIIKEGEESLSIASQGNYLKELDIQKQFEIDKEKELRIISKLKNELSILEKKIDDDSDHLKNTRSRLQNRLIKEQEKLEKENDRQIHDLVEEYEKLSQEIASKLKKIEGLRIETQLFCNQKDKTAQRQLQEEKDLTNKLIQEKIQNIENEFRPLIHNITNMIQEAEKKRSIALEASQRVQKSAIEAAELEIMDINQHHQNFKIKLLSCLRKEKLDHQEYLSIRGTSIDEIKVIYQQKLDEQVCLLQMKEIDHQNTMESLRKALDEKRINALQEAEKKKQLYDQRKISEESRLFNEHENRIQKIRMMITVKIKQESDQAFNNGVSEANEQHQKEVNLIKSKIQSYTNRLSSLQLELDNSQLGYKEKIRSLNHQNNSEYEEKLNQIHHDHVLECNQINQHMEEYKSQADELESQINDCLNEIDKLEKVTSLTPEQILEEEDHDFKKTKLDLQYLDSNNSLLISNLKNQISTIVKSNNDLLIELNKLEKLEIDHHESLKVQFTNIIESTTSKCDKLLKNEKDILHEFEINSQREKVLFENEIQKLNEDYSKSTNDLNDMMNSLQKQREEQIQSSNKQIKEKFEQTKNDLFCSHQIQVQELSIKLDNIKNNKDNNSSKHTNEFISDQESLKEQYQQKKEDLMLVLLDLNSQIQSAERALEAEKCKKCNQCIMKQEQLNHLRSKRDGLQRQYDEIVKQSVQTDQKLNKVFPTQKKVGTISSLSNKSPRIPSTLGKTPASTRRSKNLNVK